MYQASLHNRFYYTSRFTITGQVSGIQMTDNDDYFNTAYSIKTLTTPAGKPVTVTTGKVYMIGLLENAVDSTGTDVSAGYLLSGPINVVDTYIEIGNAI